MLRILSLLIHQDLAVSSEVMKTPWPDYRLLASIEEEVKEMDQIASPPLHKVPCSVGRDSLQ
jgi:hypothetical protein